MKSRVFQIFLLAASVFKVSTAIQISSNDDPRSGFLSRYIPKPIRGTTLKTATFYKVRMATNNVAMLTWSHHANMDYGYRFIFIDHTPAKLYKYDKGGSLYFHNQWFFFPAKGHPGWYHFANRGIPGEFAGWSIDAEDGSQTFYFFLNPYYSTNKPEPEYLFKLEPHGDYYQIKTKALPNAVVSKTNISPRKYRQYTLIDNTNDPRFNPGNDLYNNTLFYFEPVDDFEGIRFQATITKLEIIDNLTNAVEQDEYLANSVLRNDGPVTISEKFSSSFDTSERVYVEKPDKFSTFHKVVLEESLESQNILVGPSILKTPHFRQQLLAFLQDNEKASLNFTTNKEFLVQQTFEIPRCTEYEVNATVKTVKDYALEYEIYYQLTGEQNGEQIDATELRSEHLTEKHANEDTDYEYIDIQDDYTVLAKIKGKMWVSYGRDTTINGKGNPIESCVQEYVCAS